MQIKKKEEGESAVTNVEDEHMDIGEGMIFFHQNYTTLYNSQYYEKNNNFLGDCLFFPFVSYHFLLH